MKNDQILYLSRETMDKVGPSLAEIVELLETGFRLKGEGKVVLPAKHWLERANDRFFSAMSSYVAELGYSGCKWQSGDPLNAQRGLPYIQGLYLLTEDTLGIPVAIMDSEWITGRRTAAASAVAVRYLASPEATELAILGCGLQGRVHLEALKSVMPKLKKVRAYDIRKDAAIAFAAELAPKFDVEITVTDDPKSAVLGADVIISGGPILTPPRPVIEADWLKEGAVGVAIDYDSYWTNDAIAKMSLIVTDDQGQIDHLREYGLFLGVEKLDGELADLATGKISHDKQSKSNTLCFNLGIALEDLVTAIDIYNRAIAAGAGQYFPR
jgi:ornithine cyclodeaminase/alanine dehydrogenase